MTDEKEQKTSTGSTAEAGDATTKDRCQPMAACCGPMMAKMMAAFGAETAENDDTSSDKQGRSGCC